jgi:hypothetical protein
MRISPDLSANDPRELGDIQYQTITALAESPIRPGLLYAGTDDGFVHVLQGPGEEWTDITDGMHPGRFTSEIVASAYDEATVYVTQNGRRDDDFAPYVWRSTDHGETWESLAANVPTGPVNIIREDPENPELLYLGTDVGVYVSLDRGETWEVLANGLPSTFVHDLVIHPREDMMVAATHGQGMLAFDVRQLQQLTPDVVASDAHLFAAEGGLLPPEGRAGFGQSQQSAWVHYWLNADRDVSIEIQDATGAKVATLGTYTTRGLHQVEWTLERDGGNGGGGGFFRRRNYVAPGTYAAVLTVDGVESSVPITVERR